MSAEIDPSHGIDDEGVGDLASIPSTTQSLRSSMTEYPVEYGRQYHAYKNGAYKRPNDDAELDRLDLMHVMLSMVHNGKPHLAPIGSTPQRVLDIGAGSGSWAIEFGDLYPSAEVIGVDLSANMPKFVPPNVHFEVGDIEETWMFSRPFDYVHSRYMAASIKHWPGLVAQCFQNLQPGGWAEFSDFDIDYYSQDGSLNRDSALCRWIEYHYQAIEITGKINTPGPKLEAWFRDAGFANIQVIKQTLPIGPWPKDPRLVCVLPEYPHH